MLEGMCNLLFPGYPAACVRTQILESCARSAQNFFRGCTIHMYSVHFECPLVPLAVHLVLGPKKCPLVRIIIARTRTRTSDLLRGGLGGPGLGLDVLEDCAPSAALLLLVGHVFPDSEALLATRGAHLPEAEHYMSAGGKWGCGLNG